MNAPVVSTENRRDAGLVRALGPWGLAAGIFNKIVGAGIFAVPAVLAAALGARAPLVFVFCGIAVGAVAICFAEGGSRIPTSGGVYGYIEAALGPLAGYVGGTLLWVGDILACGGIAAALADAAGSITPVHYAPLVRPVVIVGVIGFIALVNIAGVRHGARLVAVATAVKLLPLAVFLVAGIGALRLDNFTAAPGPGGSLGHAVLTALFAAVGMEGALSVSGEVAQPSKTIPKALLLAIAGTTLLYIAIQVIAQGALGGALPASHAPLADAMGRVSPALRILMLAGTALSMIGWIGSDIMASPRTWFAFARDGLMPAVLGRVHPVARTPWVAITGYATVAIILALTGTFTELVVLSALTSTALYIGGCLAAWKLKRAGVALAGAPLGFPWLTTAMMVGCAGMVLLIALAQIREILGLLALIGISAAVYLAQQRFLKPRLIKASG